MQQKNMSIEAFRFIFMTVLCLWHIGDMVHIFYHGYLIVEFFFILSGIFIYQTYRKYPRLGIYDYAIKRFKRLWVEYFIVTIIVFCMYKRMCLSDPSLFNMKTLSQFFSETLLLQNIGFFFAPNNWASWYLSVLLIGSVIIYSLLKNYGRHVLQFIMPTTCIAIYTLLFSLGDERTFEHWETIYGLNMPLLRGIADMSVGVLLSHILYTRKSFFIHHIRKVNISSILCCIFIFIILYVEKQDDAYMLLFIPPFIVGLFCENSLLNKWFTGTVWHFLGGLSYEMYLMHIVIRGILRYTGLSQLSSYLLIVIYLTLVIISAYLLKQVGKIIRAKIGW